jgi:hypothetical protein
MRVVGEREMNKGRLQGLTGGPHMQRRRLPKPPFAPAGRASHAHALVARSRRVGPLHRRPTTRKRKKKGRGGGEMRLGRGAPNWPTTRGGGRERGRGKCMPRLGCARGTGPRERGFGGFFLFSI